MPDYLTASRTKDYYQSQLLQDHPEIVSIAPRLEVDSRGHPTGEGIIVIGVEQRNPVRLHGGAATAAPAKPIPSQLQAVNERGAFTADVFVQVIVEDTGSVVPQMNTARMRPCDGGFSVGHVNVTVGTFGGNVRFGADFGFILSNNHVLANVNAGAVGDPIIQPAANDGGATPGDVIATLTRWVPIDFASGPSTR